MTTYRIAPSLLSADFARLGALRAADLTARALGDADAVSYGDFHVAKNVVYALTGEEDGDDDGSPRRRHVREQAEGDTGEGHRGEATDGLDTFVPLERDGAGAAVGELEVAVVEQQGLDAGRLAGARDRARSVAGVPDAGRFRHRRRVGRVRQADNSIVRQGVPVAWARPGAARVR